MVGNMKSNFIDRAFVIVILLTTTFTICAIHTA